MEYPDDIMGGSDTLPAKTSSAATRKGELIGVMLDGRYLIERKLGQGGFGAVYLASDEKMVSRKVVVKVMHDKETGKEWSLKKFKQEIEALTRINHPGIVGVFDTGKTPEGTPYIVMQYVSGVSLRSLITSDGMQFSRAANIIGQMGRALSAAHQCGILHRDLKPENVMLENLEDDDEHVKIIDFGVAKVKNSLISLNTPQDHAIGTIAYMSPEQLSTQPLTPASDIYSLGVLAYEMLTGRRPSHPDSAFQLLELQRSGLRIKPTDLRPSLPKGAEAAILKALSFEPKDRYERARDFGDLLSMALLGDGELQAAASETETPESDKSESLSLETAHVLFMDLVAYSQMLIDQQKDRLSQLQQIVLATDECRRARKEDLIRLPTGDGMALVFFHGPEAPVRCAVEISRALKSQPDIELRMGVHAGLVYRVADINTNMNVTGGGINMAQRVMDCGDADHIILSKRVADDLGQLARWSSCLHDLGNAEVKHGVNVHVFNLYGDDFGNPARPAKFNVASVTPIYKRAPMIAATLVILGLVTGGIWYALRPKTTPVTQPAKLATVAPVGPEQYLTYWLTVQKMLNHKPLGPPFESAGDIAFGNGWKFRLDLRPMQSGALYLLNVGPGQNDGEEYNILFPLPPDKRPLPENKKLDPKLVANQTVQLPPKGWYNFVEQTGVEKFWIIWSTQPLPDLDAIFSDAARNKKSPGVITDADQIARIKYYLKKYDSGRPEMIFDKSKEITSVKGRGDTLVNLIELSHKAY